MKSLLLFIVGVIGLAIFASWIATAIMTYLESSDMRDETTSYTPADVK